MKLLSLILLLYANSIIASDWRLIDDLGNTNVKSVSDVNAINCTDSNNCFALVQYARSSSDYGWRLYKSTDQGNSWNITYKEKITSEQEQPIIINVHECASPHPNYHFVASEEKSVIQKSTDGGIIFKKIQLESGYEKLKSLAMYDSSIGFVTNKHYYFTTKDGWETFEIHPKRDSEQRYYSPVFLDSNSVVMIYGDDFRWNNGMGYAIVKFHFKENKWDTLYFFERDSGIYHDAMKSIYFVNDTLGFASGRRSDITVNGYYDIVYRTKDGGYNWKLVLKKMMEPKKGLYNNISFYDENNGIAVGFWGKIVMTNDGGDTWTYEELPNPMDNARKMLVTWAGRYPIIGTWDAGIFRYEGDFFILPPDTINPIIIAEDCDFGKIDLEKTDSVSKTVRIFNQSEKDDLIITGYSVLHTREFSTNLSLFDSLIIKPKGSFEYEVYFATSIHNKYLDSIIFYCNATDSDFVAYLKAEAAYNPNIHAADYDFGQYDIFNTNSLSRKLEIRNLSTEKDLIITAYSDLTDSIFSSDLPNIDSLNPMIIKPFENFEFTVYFQPKEPIEYSDSIVLFSNANFTDNVVYLTGEGIASPLIHAEDYDFGQYDIKNNDSLSTILKIQNTSLYKELKIYRHLIFNKTFSHDLPQLDSINPIIIKPKDYYEFTVFFNPKEVKEYKGRIIFYSNSQYSDNVTYLTGEGIDTVTSVVDYENKNPKYQITYTQSKLNIVINAPKPSNITIKIYDLTGNLLLSKNGGLKAGINTFEIDISKLMTGIYMYNISINGISAKTGKMNIIR